MERTNQQEDRETIVPPERIFHNCSAIEPQEERYCPNGEHYRGYRIRQRLKVVYRHDAVQAFRNCKENWTKDQVGLKGEILHSERKHNIHLTPSL